MRKLKQERGSITLFVVVAMLFFVLFLSGTYMLSNSKEQAQMSQTARIKEIYEKDINNIDDVYETLTNSQKVNAPIYIGTGLTPVTIAENGALNEVENDNNDWYSYDGEKNHWANAKTKEGSMFVWIPRYAYKINADKSIDIVFLKGTSNLDYNGNDVTSESYIDEKGVTGAYIVHPAFEDGTKNNYANGEWNKKIEGIWVAKFEAGYEGEAGKPDTAIDSDIGYSTIMSYNGSTHADFNKNYYGTRAVGTKIKYPVFKANKPSMNYIGISDAFDLCKNMTSEKAPYGLTQKVKPHLTKNSEWGAVAYLTQSKYGRNGEEVTINNVTFAQETNTIRTVTGYGASSISASQDTSRDLATLTKEGQQGSWTTAQGQKASSTKNIYGIYDLSGETWEYTAGYIAAGDNYTKYGGSLKGESNEYKSKYAGTSSTNATNYSTSPNSQRIGEAIWETSTSGSGTNSWNSDFSSFPYSINPFFVRGGYWGDTTSAGCFAFSGHNGYSSAIDGFRPVLIVE